MMQLMPATASLTARKLGVGYSADRLSDPDYNMQLGSAYLGEMVNNFSGSYVMAAAGYNAGPGRPPQWISDCGVDPRGGTSDPADFIECIPFAETRNYVMRIMEAVQVYRARLNGGTAPLTAMADLKRGAWGQTPPTPIGYNVATIGATPYENPAPIGTPPAYTVGAGPGPVPYSQLAVRAAEERASIQRSVDVAARRDDERRAAAKVQKAGKKGGKAKAASRLKNKAKVSKAKTKSKKSSRVRGRKS
jgi:hypothetical protein